jgi:hypothetical protein
MVMVDEDGRRVVELILEWPPKKNSSSEYMDEVEDLALYHIKVY